MDYLGSDGYILRPWPRPPKMGQEFSEQELRDDVLHRLLSN